MIPGRPHIAPAPRIERAQGWADYQLLDSGDGQKLERYGPYCVVRPEPQCFWPKSVPDQWAKADAIFDPDDEDDAGNWRFSRPVPDAWKMGFDDAKFFGRFTAFRHLAFFPEQEANWRFLQSAVVRRKQPRILNMFGYTGVASLVCARAGAQVTHVDASKKAIGWARENAELSKLSDAPIRWICEDARKYAQREQKRGSKYDGIILDPPKYGRGPTGEVWRLFEDLGALVEICAELLTDDPLFLILNAYAARISGPALASLLAEKLKGKSGHIEWGELALKEANPRGYEIGLSFFARFVGEDAA